MQAGSTVIDAEESLVALTRPQRLFLKRAYAASERKPFFPPINSGAGHGQQVMVRMIERGFARPVGFGAVLTDLGHVCAARLAGLGWPDCEKPNRAPSAKSYETAPHFVLSNAETRRLQWP